MAAPSFLVAILLVSSACTPDGSGVVRRTEPGERPTQQTQQEAPADEVAPADDLPAPADDLPPPLEPWLADPGDWAADFNELQVACYRGSMRACDAIWLDDRVLMDSWLYEYGYLCGGRIRGNGGDPMLVRRRLYDAALCVEIFPGHD